MSVTRSFSATKYAPDHFEPEGDTDPQAQRRIRGQLEQIDYTAYASNKAVIAQMLGGADTLRFQKLAVAAAGARARWVDEALKVAEAARAPRPEDVKRLEELRSAYAELAEAYEALRRMVERGYVAFAAAPSAA